MLGGQWVVRCVVQTAGGRNGFFFSLSVSDRSSVNTLSENTSVQR